MSKKVFKIIVVCLIIILLLIPVFKEMSNNTGFRTIKYDDYKKAVENTESYKLALIYAAPKSIETTEESKETIKEVLKDITKDDEEITPYYIDSDDLKADAIKALKLDETTGQAYIFASNGEAIKIISGGLSKEDLVKYVNLYSANGIDESLVKYRTAKSAETFMKRVKKDEVTMAVFGRDNCYYCQQFLPVVNTVAEEKALDYVYYFDSNNYDEDFTEVITKADVGVVKLVSDQISHYGDEITWTVRVTNYGPSMAENVVLIDYLPIDDLVQTRQPYVSKGQISHQVIWQ